MDEVGRFYEGGFIRRVIYHLKKKVLIALTMFIASDPSSVALAKEEAKQSLRFIRKSMKGY
jgi:hypothetical protein